MMLPVSGAPEKARTTEVQLRDGAMYVAEVSEKGAGVVIENDFLLEVSAESPSVKTLVSGGVMFIGLTLKEASPMGPPPKTNWEPSADLEELRAMAKDMGKYTTTIYKTDGQASPASSQDTARYISITPCLDVQSSGASTQDMASYTSNAPNSEQARGRKTDRAFRVRWGRHASQHGSSSDGSDGCTLARVDEHGTPVAEGDGSGFYAKSALRDDKSDAGAEAGKAMAVSPCDDELFEEDGQMSVTNGSLGHPFFCQRPCNFLARGFCQQGSSCGFCHLQHDNKPPMRLDTSNKRRLERMGVAGRTLLLAAVLNERLRDIQMATDGTILIQEWRRAVGAAFPVDAVRSDDLPNMQVGGMVRLLHCLQRMHFSIICGIIRTTCGQGILLEATETLINGMRALSSD